jgi:hypothetical protein
MCYHQIRHPADNDGLLLGRQLAFGTLQNFVDLKIMQFQLKIF